MHELGLEPRASRLDPAVQLLAARLRARWRGSNATNRTRRH